MFKNKYVVFGVIFVIIVIVVGTWFYIGRGGEKSSVQKPAPTPAPYNGHSQPLDSSQGGHSISLTDPKPGSRPKNSLLNNNPGPAADQSGLNPQTLGSNQRQSSSAESMLDPKTFGQYDKYKEDKGARFAELLEGEGEELVPGKKAAVYYKGWLTDGTLFDMSRSNKKGELEPFVFQMGGGQVIPGWEQALAGMKVGGVRFLIVPPAVGYGEQGQDPIPSNSVLIFQVQLLAVE